MVAHPEMSVLLVDDDADTRKIFQMVLAHHNLDLMVVSNAEAAFEYLRTHSPDIIILDMFLPGTDGPQALATIRRQGLAPDSVMIATTAFYSQQTAYDIEAWGFSGFIPKPFSSAELVSSL